MHCQFIVESGDGGGCSSGRVIMTAGMFTGPSSEGVGCLNCLLDCNPWLFHLFLFLVPTTIMVVCAGGFFSSGCLIRIRDVWLH